jgi:uncharacterized protein (TIGR00255 family)
MSQIHSMTGFGRAEATSEAGTITVEIKSVNHRFLDSRVHLPREMAAFEIPLLRTVKERLGRGKVDVSVRWAPSAAYVPRLHFNASLLTLYQEEIRTLARRSDCDGEVGLEYLLGLPGVAEKETPDVEQAAMLELTSSALAAALDTLVAERKREGSALLSDFLTRLDVLEAMRKQVEERRVEVTDLFRTRLAKKAAEWAKAASVQIDSGRLETEVLLFAERSDISEELTRLDAHIAAYRQNLSGKAPGPHGKPLEFLTQELLRETNTIASKARDLSIASATIEMKNEIEKLREQVMNVE